MNPSPGVSTTSSALVSSCGATLRIAERRPLTAEPVSSSSDFEYPAADRPSCRPAGRGPPALRQLPGAGIEPHKAFAHAMETEAAVIRIGRRGRLVLSRRILGHGEPSQQNQQGGADWGKTIHCGLPGDPNMNSRP